MGSLAEKSWEIRPKEFTASWNKLALSMLPPYTGTLMLRAILAKLKPEPAREPLPPPKVYAPAASNGRQEATARGKSEPSL